MIIHPGIVLAIALAFVHGFSSRLPIFSIIPQFRWTSFAGGVSLGYVFVEIFPELSHIQEEIQHSEISMIEFLENHVYIMALIGLIVFYGLDLLAIKPKPVSSSNLETKVESNHLMTFWIHIIAFAAFNSLIGYLLQNLSQHSLIDCILFFITVALHLLVTDDHLRKHQPKLYEQKGRWLLVGAIIFGAITGQVTALNKAAIGLVWSFLAGSIILNVLKRELPDENKTCFGSLIGGATLFTLLLLFM